MISATLSGLYVAAFAVIVLGIWLAEKLFENKEQE